MGMRDFLGKLSGGRNSELSQYETLYAKHLGSAFADRKTERNLLLTAAKFFGTRKYDQALPILGKLMERCAVNEDRRAVLMFTALCRSRIGDTEGAIDAYRKLLDIAPQSGSALSNLGHLLQEQGKFRAAEEYYLRAMHCDPYNPYAKNNLATLYYAMGEYEQAIPYGEQSLELKGDLYQAATVLGMCHMALGNREEGARYGRLAVTNGQNPEDMKNALKRAWESRLTAPEVSEEFEKVLREWKRRTAVHTNLVYATQRSVGRSRIGGPSLGPAPLDSRGRPMRLLCAIYCEEFRESPILPREGLLRFYIAQNETYGLNFDAPNVQTDFRVLYDREFTHLTPGEDPGPSPDFPVGGCYSIGCDRLRKQAMPPVDYRFDAAFGNLLKEMGAPEPSDDDMEVMDELFSPECHRIGGYAHFTQYDPRFKPEYAGYDTLLLQLDNMDISGMHIDIGDCGVMNFFISREKLEKLDFSDILYWWDCC